MRLSVSVSTFLPVEYFEACSKFTSGIEIESVRAPAFEGKVTGKGD